MSTRTAAHASGGQARATKLIVERPETVVMGLDGQQTFTLPRRSTQDTVPAFQKYNPRKVDPKSRQRLGPSGRPFVPGQRRPGMVPFGRLLFAMFIAQGTITFIKNRLLNRQHSTAEESSSDYEGGEGPATPGSASNGPHNKQPRLLPAMLQAAMPRPQRKGLAARRSEAHHMRPDRGNPTAWQRMHPSNSAKKRSPGALERWAKELKKAAACLPPPPAGHLLLPPSGLAAPHQITGTAPEGRLQEEVTAHKQDNRAALVRGGLTAQYTRSSAVPKGSCPAAKTA